MRKLSDSAYKKIITSKAHRTEFLGVLTRSALGDQLREAREKMNLSQRELAEATGICQQQISRTENVGKSTALNLRTLIKFADALGMGVVIKIAPIDECLEAYGYQINRADDH